MIKYTFENIKKNLDVAVQDLDNELIQIKFNALDEFNYFLDNYLIVTGLIISSWDEGYYVTTLCDYFITQHEKLNEAYRVNHEQKLELLNLNHQLVLDVSNAVIDYEYHYSRIQQLMLIHKKNTSHIKINYDKRQLKEKIKKHYIYSEKLHHSRLNGESPNKEQSYSRIPENEADKLLCVVLNSINEEDKFGRQFVKYPHEPFNNFKVQFDEFGKSIRVEFTYQGTNMAFRTKLQPSMGYGAYGWSDSDSENILFSDEEEDGVALLGESFLSKVFKNMFSEADWLHRKCGGKQDDDSNDCQPPYEQIVKLYDESKKLTLEYQI
jgi:hypothetical protein